jgi:hypothetical protein
MDFQVINDFIHIFEGATVTVPAGAVVALGKVAVSRLDIDIVTSSDKVNEVFCACSKSRAKATATFIPHAFFFRPDRLSYYKVHLNVALFVYCTSVQQRV